jgi:hypothetical protein
MTPTSLVPVKKQLGHFCSFLPVIVDEKGRCNHKHFSFQGGFVISLPLSCPLLGRLLSLKVLKVG